jgi:hypothetical protein
VVHDLRHPVSPSTVYRLPACRRAPPDLRGPRLRQTAARRRARVAASKAPARPACHPGARSGHRPRRVAASPRAAASRTAAVPRRPCARRYPCA